MASLTCSFCKHVNPDGSKFCNECGSVLGLRPCAQCDAINDVGATYCHHCGMLLDGRLAESVGQSVASSRGAIAASDSSVVRASGGLLPEFTGTRAAAASARELSSAAERLDAFWRDSMQAVEVARALNPESPAPQRPVETLPLPVDGESPVIDLHESDRSARGGLRMALALAALALCTAAAFYGYERLVAGRTRASDSPPVLGAPVLTAPGALAPSQPAVSEASPPTTVGAPAADSQERNREPAQQAAGPVAGTMAASPDAALPIPPPQASPDPSEPPAASTAEPSPASESPGPAAQRREPAPTTPPASRAVATRRPHAAQQARAEPRTAPLPAPLAPPVSTAAPVTSSVATCTDGLVALGLCKR